MVRFEKYGLCFRTVILADAEFVFRLRSNESLSKFLTPVFGGVDEQRKWIGTYLEREAEGKEYYFITEDNLAAPLGLNRLYNLKGKNFELGSWLFDQHSPENAPILADFAVRDFAFEELNMQVCTFEVRKENKSVIRYHKAFGPTMTGEDELNYYFSLSYEKYRTYRDKILKIIL